MIGIVNIQGFIGDPIDFAFDIGDMPNTTLLDVVKQVENNKDATEYHIFINSIGGSVDEGYAIFNYLKSLKKPVNTFAGETCQSIATVPFLAGSRRVIDANCNFMFHPPWGDPGPGNADRFENFVDQMRELEDGLTSFYAKYTGTSKEAFKALLNEDRVLTAQEAVDLGFATEIETVVTTVPLNTSLKAVAFSNILNQKTMSNQLTKKEAEGFFNKIMAKIDGIIKPKAVNITLQDSNGVEIEFPSVEQGQTPAVGDAALINGAPVPNAEGSELSVEYIMPSLGDAVVVFRDGVVDSIAMPNAGDEEMMALKNEVAGLKKKVADKEAELQAANAENQKMVTDVLALKTEIRKFKAVAGGFNPDGGKEPPGNDNEGGASSFMKDGYKRKERITF